MSYFDTYTKMNLIKTQLKAPFASPYKQKPALKNLSV